MKLSEVLKEVIRLASASRDYWDRELPKRHPNYPLLRAGEDSGPAPPEEKELDDFLRKLPPEQIYALILLMYLGRGDFGTEDLDECYKTMKETFPRAELAVTQMSRKGFLAEYLADALAELQAHQMDVDKLDFAAAPAHH